MRKFTDVFKEINYVMNNIEMFQVMMSTIIVFLSFYLVLSFINMKVLNPLYSLIPAIIYFGIMFFIKLKESNLKKVEEKYKNLDEKLRTAKDNIYSPSPIVEKLKREIVSDMRYVEASEFFDSKTALIKTIVSIVLCFMIIFIISFDIYGIDLKKVYLDLKPDINAPEKGDGPPDSVAGGIGGIGLTPIEEDIYGVEEVAELGDEVVNIELESSGYEINVRDIREVEKKYFEDTFPSEIDLASAATFEENIPKEQQELVSNYFKELAK